MKCLKRGGNLLLLFFVLEPRRWCCRQFRRRPPRRQRARRRKRNIVLVWGGGCLFPEINKRRRKHYKERGSTLKWGAFVCMCDCFDIVWQPLTHLTLCNNRVLTVIWTILTPLAYTFVPLMPNHCYYMIKYWYTPRDIAGLECSQWHLHLFPLLKVMLYDE